MKTIILSIANYFYKVWRKFKAKQNPVISDLLDNDHDFCDNCGEIFYKATPKKRFCSNTCRMSYHNSRR